MAGRADTMNESKSPAVYEIRIKGRLAGDIGAAWFDGMEVRPAANDETLLVGPVIDQAALYGLLARLRDLALPLVSVRRIDPNPRA